LANIKTAISIEKPLFDEVENLAEELQISRSRIFTLAARDFIQRHKSRKLLAAINAAYPDSSDAAEERLRYGMKNRQFQLVKDQW